MLEKVKRWLSEEPVRVWMYGVLEGLAGLLVLYGVVSAAAVPVVMGVVSAVLAVPVAKKVRSKVTPVSKLDRRMAEVVAANTYEPCETCPEPNCGKCQ